MFVFLFLSSASLPRELIEVDWFRTVATWNPVSYIVEGLRAPLVEGWDWEALALGFGISGVVFLRVPGRRDHRPCAPGWRGHERSGHPSVTSVALAVAWRYLTNIRKNPAFLLPPLIFPIFFLVAFAGGLSAVSNAPGFDYPDYTAFQFAFVLLQSAAFAGRVRRLHHRRGLRVRLRAAADARRAAALRHRAGYALVSLGRCRLRPACSSAAWPCAAGMQVNGSAFDMGGLLLLALLVNIGGDAVRRRHGAAAARDQRRAAMQVPVFLILFLAPVYVPVDLLHGWIQSRRPGQPGDAHAGGGARPPAGRLRAASPRPSAARSRCWSWPCRGRLAACAAPSGRADAG